MLVGPERTNFFFYSDTAYVVAHSHFVFMPPTTTTAAAAAAANKKNFVFVKKLGTSFPGQTLVKTIYPIASHLLPQVVELELQRQELEKKRQQLEQQLEQFNRVKRNISLTQPFKIFVYTNIRKIPPPTQSGDHGHSVLGPQCVGSLSHCSRLIAGGRKLD